MTPQLLASHKLFEQEHHSRNFKWMNILEGMCKGLHPVMLCLYRSGQLPCIV